MDVMTSALSLSFMMKTGGTCHLAAVDEEHEEQHGQALPQQPDMRDLS